MVAGQDAKPFNLAQTNAPSLNAVPSASLQSFKGVFALDISSAPSVLTSCLTRLTEVTIKEGAEGTDEELLNLPRSIFFFVDLARYDNVPAKTRWVRNGPASGCGPGSAASPTARAGRFQSWAVFIVCAIP